MGLLSIRSLAGTTLILLAACGGGGGSTPATPQAPPTISGVSPAHGSPGSTVVLTGTNLAGATAVSFNGHGAFSFAVAGSTQVSAVVPGDATTGSLTVTTPGGSAASPAFTVDAALAPSLASFSPAVLASGTVATLVGTHLVGTTQVRFNGVDATGFSVVSDTQLTATAPAGLTAGTIAVTTPGGTATTGTGYTVGQSVQVLMNGTFEQASPTIWQGDTGTIQTAPGSSSPGAVPHGGTHFAWLGGYGSAASDQLTQDLYVPATAQSASVSFYLKILTSETGTAATDTLSVAVLTPSGTPLGTLLSQSNLDASGYTLCTADLLPYKGQVVRLSFKSQENAQNATSFLLDDVTASILAPAADLKPIINSFTPPSGVVGEGSVQVSGCNFFGLTDVTIGGSSAAYTLKDGTGLTATVPAGAAIGSAPIRMANAQGTGSSATSFTVTYGIPTVTSVAPSQGPVGTPVVITGTYLGSAGTTTLTLKGQPITPTSQGAYQINFTVPPGATSGSLVITAPGGTVDAGTFTVTTASSTLDLHIDKIQLTQSSQTLDNAVPIVAGKDGLLRVFVLANLANAASPQVQVTLLNNGVPVAGYPKLIAAPGSSVPLSLNEAALASSWNLAVPGTELTTPTGSGYSVQAIVDPSGAIPEADKTNNATTLALAGTTVPTFRATIFPVVLSTGTGNITDANKAAWVARLARMFPVAALDVVTGATFTGSVSTLSSDGTGWNTLLSDLTAKHLADSATAGNRYYYGALKVSYGSGVAGIGWVPGSPGSSFQYRTAIGWDKTGYSDGGNYPEVFAHETGHNMGRSHSPCGSVASSDPNYPYAGGLIGVWGYDTGAGALKSPATYKDIMAYCTPDWVSDYVYKGILAFRNGTGGFLKAGAEDASLPKGQAEARECLIVRGIVHDSGKVELLPSFRTRALPSTLPGSGDYTLECLDLQGHARYSTPLDLTELGCWPQGRERHFVMALPLAAADLDALAGLNVVKSGLIMASLRSASAPALLASAPPDVNRVAEDRVQVTWDATVHPTVMVRDADSGEVLAILAGGRQTITATARRFDLVLSDGVTSRTHRLEPAN